MATKEGFNMLDGIIKSLNLLSLHKVLSLVSQVYRIAQNLNHELWRWMWFRNNNTHLLFDSFSITTIKQKHRVENPKPYNNLKPTWRLSQGVYWYKLALHKNQKSNLL